MVLSYSRIYMWKSSPWKCFLSLLFVIKQLTGRRRKRIRRRGSARRVFFASRSLQKKKKQRATPYEQFYRGILSFLPKYSDQFFKIETSNSFCFASAKLAVGKPTEAPTITALRIICFYLRDDTVWSLLDSVHRSRPLFFFFFFWSYLSTDYFLYSW